VKRANFAMPTPRRVFLPGPRRPAQTITQPRLGPDELLHIHITKCDGYTVVHLIGELDLTSSTAAYPTLISLLCQDDPRVVFDMAGVTFADSSGLSMMWHLSDFAVRCEGWVRLSRVAPNVQRIIDMLSRTFPEPLSIYQTTSAAVAGTQLPA
jgi:anti-anti-sigma factor